MNPTIAEADAGKTPTPPQERTSVTAGSGIFNGHAIDYTATCGTLILHEDAEKDGTREGEKPRAEVFYTAYTKNGVADPAGRPIMFCFNGGPGSSAIWLHMTLFGPVRVALDDDGRAGKPPHRLVPNECCLLDCSDVVFIDPVGTGYSRMVEGEKTAQYHDIVKDVESVGEFIRLYCSRNARWASPKFIAGESYGTTRACGLADYLQSRHGMALNGLLLISCALDFITLWTEASDLNDLPFVMFLPTMTATAWYHKRLPADLQALPLTEVIAQAEAFAAHDYTLALFKGRALPVAERDRIAAQVARFTGLSEQFIKNCDLRIDDGRFYKELLRDRGQTVGRIDSRFTGEDRDNAGEAPLADASMHNLFSACATAFNDYVRRTLRFEADSAYGILTGLHKTWKWGAFENKYATVSDQLRSAMQANPHLKVFVANGYYDMATPHFATDYTIDHLRVSEALRRNIEVHYYEGGHMMYIHKPSLEAMAAHMRGFVAASI
jgi:carboxypeptidase C (cathepsin A)